MLVLFVGDLQAHLGHLRRLPRLDLRDRVLDVVLTRTRQQIRVIQIDVLVLALLAELVLTAELHILRVIMPRARNMVPAIDIRPHRSPNNRSLAFNSLIIIRIIEPRVVRARAGSLVLAPFVRAVSFASKGELGGGVELTNMVQVTFIFIIFMII